MDSAVVTRPSRPWARGLVDLRYVEYDDHVAVVCSAGRGGLERLVARRVGLRHPRPGDAPGVPYVA